jgi:hypothetical protein
MIGLELISKDSKEEWKESISKSFLTLKIVIMEEIPSSTIPYYIYPVAIESSETFLEPLSEIEEKDVEESFKEIEEKKAKEFKELKEALDWLMKEDSY